MTVLSWNGSYAELELDGGLTVRISYTGNHGWRLQTGQPGGPYEDRGAAQLLSSLLEEKRDFPVIPFEKTYVKENGLTLKAPDGSRVRIRTEKNEIVFFTPSHRTAAVWTGLRKENGFVIAEGKLKRKEAVYGTGERYDRTNQRGKRLTLYSLDIWDQIRACYMVIPLFCFSRGSGIFVNRYEYMEADLGAGDRDRWSVSLKKAPLDCYVFATDRLSEVLYGYSALTGFARRPPDWTFGMLVCRYYPDFSTREGILTAIRKMEEHDLPWGGLLLEGWPTYDRSRWEELREICEFCRARGKKVLCYMFVGEWGRIPLPDPSYLLKRRDRDGLLSYDFPAIREGALNPDFGPGIRSYRYLDLTDREVCDWYFGEIWTELSREVGVSGCKIDFCELLPDTDPILLRNGLPAPAGAHHWWPVVFATKYLDCLSQTEEGGMCFTRGGGIGSQRNPYMWAGDQTRKHDRLRWQLTCMLESGLSGVPFMSYDMSGYQYGKYAQALYDNETGKLYFGTKVQTADGETELPVYPREKEADVFLRGTEFTCFSINMQTHGKVRRPYDFAEEGDLLTTGIYREYVRLHDRLTPYLSEYADRACETGLPVLRHLILAYPEDPKVRDIDDEYLFGDAFLVAPVLEEARSRTVYLPKGEWRDLLTDEHYTVGSEGLVLEEKAGLAQIPVFYRPGTASLTAETVLGPIRDTFARLAAIAENT